MSKQIIKAFEKRETIPSLSKDTQVLNVSEFYYDTIQGEGIHIGAPAAFLRLQNCTLNCTYCDTTEVWRSGNPYTLNELFDLMEQHDLIAKFKQGVHLVITGGSPLKQQWDLIPFFTLFADRYKFLPFIEIENECVLRPVSVLIDIVSCWNNSPKLSSSGNSRKARYKPEIISYMASLANSWFKFVVESEEDWEEIQMDFIDPILLVRSQIILMPLGATRQELYRNQKMTADLAVKHTVKYCSREHIVLWDKNAGV
jgi:7-carboxy-7-deazaguanine synthase